MPMSLSQRARAIQPSVTFALSTRAKELRAEGKPVLDLTLGEPDLPTPAPVVEAAQRALVEGHFHYTPTAGVPALRRAIAEQYSARLGLPVTPSMTIATQGAKQALFNAMATAADPGDKVILLAPYWISYVEQAHALELEPVAIPCPADQAYRPDLDRLRAELQGGARILVLNSPCNPTGAAYDREEMRAITELVRESGAVLISDEIYEDIVYREDGHVSPLHLAPDLADRTCVVTGLSKGFAMTGWRVGFSIAPEEWSAAMIRLQGHTTSHIAAVCQQAAIAALAHHELVVPLVETFARRRERVLRRLEGIPSLRALTPEGTFYLFLDCRSLLGGEGPTRDATALVAWLLEEQYLGLVPGDDFGAPGHIRMSFAASDAVLDESFDRLADALSRL
jgi:aspartate aminotransferase